MDFDFTFMTGCFLASHDFAQRKFKNECKIVRTVWNSNGILRGEICQEAVDVSCLMIFGWFDATEEAV